MTEIDARTVDIERRVRLGGRLGPLASSDGDVYVTVRALRCRHRGGTLESWGCAASRWSTRSIRGSPTWASRRSLAGVTGDGLVAFRQGAGPRA